MRRRAGSGSHVAIMAAQMHMYPDEAGKRFDDAQAKMKQVRNHAAQSAKNAAASAAVASRTSFAAFADLSPGAVAAAIGGVLAIQRRVRVTERAVR